MKSQRKDSLIEFCRSLPGATEDVKWGHDLTDRTQVPVETVKKLLAESHRLVAEKLSKKARQTLGF